MDFVINTPFKFSLNLIELDEHIPSMKLSFHLEASSYDNELKHIGSTWVEIKEYNDFLISLGNKNSIKSELNSMDNDLNLTLNKTKNHFLSL